MNRRLLTKKTTFEPPAQLEYITHKFDNVVLSQNGAYTGSPTDLGAASGVDAQ